MVKTNIEYFNYTMKLFINDIIKIKSQYKDVLETYYKELLESEECNEDKYIKRFMKKTEDYKSLISERNETLFDNSILLFKNVDFCELWKSEEITNSHKETIWEYIQTLYVLGETILSDSDKIKNLVENFKKIRNNEEIDKQNNEEDDIINMVKNLTESQNKSSTLFDENILENGLIGGLAKELAGEINIDNLNLNIDKDSDNINDVFSNLMSGDNPMNFMNLIQNVGQKIQKKLESADIDQSKLMDEAQTMMGMLGNNNPMFDNLLKTAKKGMEEANKPLNPTQERLRKKLEQRNKK